MSHPFTESDLTEPHQSLVVGRRLLEVLVDAHRSGAPVALIGDLNDALKAAFLVPHNEHAHEAVARAADSLGDRYGPTNNEVIVFRDELDQLAAHRTLNWAGTEDARARYLVRSDGMGRPRTPISANDRFIATFNLVIADVAYGSNDGHQPVAFADHGLGAALEFAIQSEAKWRLWELRGLVAEIAGFRTARIGSARKPEKRTLDWRNFAFGCYRKAQEHAPDSERERIDERHCLGSSEPRSRSNHTAHLQPFGSVAWFLDTTKYSADVLEAVDLAQIRGAFGTLNEQGEGVCFDCGPSGPDLLLGLFLVDGCHAQAILSDLGVHEVQLRDAVQEVKREVPRSMTPGTVIHSLHAASDRAAMSDQKLIGGEHLLHALAFPRAQTAAKQVLTKLGITPQQIRQGVDAASPPSRGPVATL